MIGQGEEPVGRSWLQRLLIAFNLLLITAVVAGAGGVSYLYWQFEQIDRQPIAEGILAPAAPKGEPENYLLVGTDTRDFVENADEEEGFGSTYDSSGSGHSDTTIIVRVDPRTNQAAMLSFPRDLWVTIPGQTKTGGMQRINTAFVGTVALGIPGPELNGPELLIETIKLNFGIPINHYAQVDIKGFQAVVEALGGVTIPLATPIRDWDRIERRNQTGLDITRTGCVVLNGGEALAYVRSRHFESLQNGVWVSDGGSDLQRNARQQDFLRRAANKALTQVLNPVKLKNLIEAGTDNIKLGPTVKVENLVSLAKSFRTLDAETLGQYALPVVYNTRFGASILDLAPGTEAQREAIFDVFRGVTPALVPTTTTTVAPPGGPPAQSGGTTTTSTAAGPSC